MQNTKYNHIIIIHGRRNTNNTTYIFITNSTNIPEYKNIRLPQNAKNMCNCKQKLNKTAISKIQQQ